LILTLISAVDAHVGNFILKECFVNYLKNKTRVLVTHKFESLKYVDYIYIFKKGRIVEEGTVEALKGSEIFHEIEEKYKTTSKVEEKKEEEEVSLSKTGSSQLEEQISTAPIEELAPIEAMIQEKSQSKEEAQKVVAEEDKELLDKLMLDEDREIGNVGWKVWKSYFTYYGGWFFFFLTFMGNFYLFQFYTYFSYEYFYCSSDRCKLLAFLLE